ncbi:MAG: aminomethyl-transferring glycine dehydrogenase subunit GcvPA [Fibrobacter sp.]|jgi:glycine dehydrogenase subunit 1|nr:aminomethyl-transferring glycine dehydrogenase subunit GcvPA [Fibrobacter sp.]
MSFIANTEEQQREMLRVCGVNSIDELFVDIPPTLKPRSFSLPQGKSELEIDSFFQKLAKKNSTDLISFLGGGFYDHFIPAAVDALASRSEFYTAYTPYQPEISQGMLQAIYEYQTDICRLTGLDFSNASLYDGGTALYEACQIAINATGRRKIVIDGGVNPIYRRMVHTYTANLSIELVEVMRAPGQTDRNKIFEAMDDKTAALLLQNPDFFGTIDDHSDIAEKCHSLGILVVQSVYPVAMAFLKSPAEQGIDIATGEGQPLGNPLSFGGPYLGFMAVRKEQVRKMPGRMVAATVDSRGQKGFVLSLQAREQHIRREKATSNICSNEALCALRAHIYLSLMGKEGLKDVASLCIDKAHYAMEKIKKIPGVSVMDSSPIFNEFTVKLPINAEECVEKMIGHGFAAGFPLGRYYPGMENHLLIAVTEKRTEQEISRFSDALEEVLCR